MASTIDLSALAHETIESAGRSDEPFGLYVMNASDPAAELARSVERDVFHEYFDNTSDLLETEYAPYDSSSIFLCVLDHRREVPAGVMRVILPSPAGFKTLDAIDDAWGQEPAEVLARTGLDLSLNLVWDIATLAVTRDYRGSSSDGLVSLSLYHGLAQLAVRSDVRWVIATLDLIVLDLLQSAASKPFIPFTGIEPRSYLDSASSLPVWCQIIDFQERLVVENPTMYEVMFLGRGLEAAVSAPDWDQDSVVQKRLAHSA
ncbi:MAG: hypothetical protein WCK41_04120 [Actinomycetes bacterium]